MLINWIRRWRQRRREWREAIRIHRELEAERGKGWWRDDSEWSRNRRA